MSTDAASTTPAATKVDALNATDASLDKGKAPLAADASMDSVDDEEEDDDDEEEEEDEDMEDDEEELAEIDPTVIQSRRTRGVKVDYNSAEARAKAGLSVNPADDKDDDEEDTDAKDVEMK